jgi:hypothetical protein
MRLCFGWARRPVQLSITSRVLPEYLSARLLRFVGPTDSQLRHTRPVFLEIEGTYLRIPPGAFWFACQAAAIYHNALAYDAPSDDGFQAEMQQIEAEVQARIDAEPTESSDNDSVTSAEDLVYDNFFYQ